MALDILRVLARGGGLFDEALAGIADDLGDKPEPRSGGSAKPWCRRD